MEMVVKERASEASSLLVLPNEIGEDTDVMHKTTFISSGKPAMNTPLITSWNASSS